MYTPVAFFAFNRPYHTNETLKSLSQNKIAIDTELFAFIDGTKKNHELHIVDNVEKIIKSYSNNFKKITIFRSPENLSGNTMKRIHLSNLFSKFESIIVLEDDNLVSKTFLDYMNKALIRYKDVDKVWQINGYNYPNQSTLYQEAFFTRSLQSWGFGLWRDRWFKFIDDKLASDPYYLISKFDKAQIKAFNLDIKHDINWSMVIAISKGKLKNPIDLFREAHIFMNKGLCLSPRVSLVRNIGHDDSGVRCKTDRHVLNERLNNNKIISFPKETIEDKKGLKDLQDFFNKKYSLRNRILNRLKIFYSKLEKIFFQ